MNYKFQYRFWSNIKLNFKFNTDVLSNFLKDEQYRDNFKTCQEKFFDTRGKISFNNLIKFKIIMF